MLQRQQQPPPRLCPGLCGGYDQKSRIQAMRSSRLVKAAVKGTLDVGGDTTHQEVFDALLACVVAELAAPNMSKAVLLSLALDAFLHEGGSNRHYCVSLTVLGQAFRAWIATTFPETTQVSEGLQEIRALEKVLGHPHDDPKTLLPHVLAVVFECAVAVFKQHISGNAGLFLVNERFVGLVPDNVLAHCFTAIVERSEHTRECFNAWFVAMAVARRAGNGSCVKTLIHFLSRPVIFHMCGYHLVHATQCTGGQRWVDDLFELRQVAKSVHHGLCPWKLVRTSFWDLLARDKDTSKTPFSPPAQEALALYILKKDGHVPHHKCFSLRCVAGTSRASPSALLLAIHRYRRRWRRGRRGTWLVLCS